jgi:hypothetical protein
MERVVRRLRRTRRESSSSGAVAGIILGAAVVACSTQEQEPAGGGAAGASDLYALATIASVPAALPTCTSDIEGAVAYVVTPSSLWRCSHRRWVTLECTEHAAGAVAYASTSGTLVACVGGSWVAVTLPAGPAGPAGEAGPQGPQGPAGEAGANAAPPLVALVPFDGAAGPCTAGGTKILAGVDANFDGALQPSEVTATSFVCNGVGAASTEDAGDTSNDVSLDAPLDSALESSPDAPPCGGLGGPCCSTGAPCSTIAFPGPSLVCQQGTCVSCGSLGGPCCSGASCTEGHTLCFQPNAAVPAVCAEPGTGNGPCSSSLFCANGGSPGAACVTGFTCNAAPGAPAGFVVTSTCVPCGKLGQPCCTNAFDAMTRGIASCGGQLCTDGSRCQQAGPLQCVSP